MNYKIRSINSKLSNYYIIFKFYKILLIFLAIHIIRNVLVITVQFLINDVSSVPVER